MTIRLAVISTAKNTNFILDRLREIGGDRVEVVFHLGDKTSQFKASSLSRILPTKGFEGHLMDDAPYTGAAEALVHNPEFYGYRDLFSEHMNRTSESHKYNSHPLKDLQDYYDYYQVLTDRLATEIKERRVDHVLFFNVPHLGYDTALYHVARALSIPVTILTQSFFPNRFYSMEYPEDLGVFPANPEAEPYRIEKGTTQKLWYMGGVKQENEEPGRISARAVAQLMTFLLWKRRWGAANPFYVAKIVRHMNRIYGQFPKWRDPFARFFHEDELAYFDHLATFEDQEVDLSGDFVYFPLQMQPEMTTSALGGLYRDLAYCIERLSKLLPPGVRILVKENPKQGAYMRGPLFFHRLRRIPSVTFLPCWVNTHELTQRSKAVAVVTGTAGWEALRQGVPVLCFGRAWYRGFAGVTEYRPDLTWDQITAPFEHSALEANVGALHARAHEGVVDRHYTGLHPGYDPDVNATGVAETLLGLIERRLSVTFPPTRDA